MTPKEVYDGYQGGNVSLCNQALCIVRITARDNGYVAHKNWRTGEPISIWESRYLTLSQAKANDFSPYRNLFGGWVDFARALPDAFEVWIDDAQVERL